MMNWLFSSLDTLQAHSHLRVFALGVPSAWNALPPNIRSMCSPSGSAQMSPPLKALDDHTKIAIQPLLLSIPFILYYSSQLLSPPNIRSNQSILKEISPGISLQGMMLKLKLQYFGHLLRRVDSLEKTLMLGGIRGRRRRGRQR